MKVSELIKKLALLHQDMGDVEVLIDTETVSENSCGEYSLESSMQVERGEGYMIDPDTDDMGDKMHPIIIISIG